MLMTSPTPPQDSADEGTPVSVKIRERLALARKRFNANDNIAEFIQPGELERLLDEVEVKMQGVLDSMVIDTAGDFSPAVTAALSASDLTIVPVKPSLVDITAVQRTVEGLRTLKRKHAFVVSQAMPTAPARVEEAARILVRTAPLAQAIISTRADYLDAMMMGQGVTEYAPTGRAAEEIRALWTWAKDELEAGE